MRTILCGKLPRARVRDLVALAELLELIHQIVLQDESVGLILGPDLILVIGQHSKKRPAEDAGHETLPVLACTRLCNGVIVAMFAHSYMI